MSPPQTQGVTAGWMEPSTPFPSVNEDEISLQAREVILTPDFLMEKARTIVGFIYYCEPENTRESTPDFKLAVSEPDTVRVGKAIAFALEPCTGSTGECHPHRQLTWHSHEQGGIPVRVVGQCPNQ